MVALTAVSLKTYLISLWNRVLAFQRKIDVTIMQDLAIESHCMLSGAFITLCGVCMAIVLLVAIGFALDKVDIEHGSNQIFEEILMPLYKLK